MEYVTRHPENVPFAISDTRNLVDTLRKHSRQLVRELGFMRATLAGSNLAPSGVHALIEIGQTPGLSAHVLAQRLRLDKSNMSRQLAKLESMHLVSRAVSDHDRRTSALTLTPIGARLLAKIEQSARTQVAGALQHLTPNQQHTLVDVLGHYVNALEVHRGTRSPAHNDIHTEILHAEITEGYQPGCIGDIAALHARFYAREAGFGAYFEQKVATECAAFTATLPAADKGLWLYRENGRFLASIALDRAFEPTINTPAPPPGDTAHLRWFIVDESLRGRGIGRALLTRALAFADQQYGQTRLWTFQGLDAARHLYESTGFRLTESRPGTQWGNAVTEQCFCRNRPASTSQTP